MIGEETACRPRQVRHEVDDDVVDEDPDGRKRNVGKCVGYRYSGRTVEGIVRLLLQNGTAEHLDRHFTERVECAREKTGEHDRATGECSR